MFPSAASSVGVVLTTTSVPARLRERLRLSTVESFERGRCNRAYGNRCARTYVHPLLKTSSAIFPESEICLINKEVVHKRVTVWH